MDRSDLDFFAQNRPLVYTHLKRLQRSKLAMPFTAVAALAILFGAVLDLPCAHERSDHRRWALLTIATLLALALAFLAYRAFVW